MTPAVLLTLAVLLGFAMPGAGPLEPVRVDGDAREATISSAQWRAVPADGPGRLPSTLSTQAAVNADAAGYWVALRLRNAGRDDVVRYLQIPDPLYGDVRVWVGNRRGFDESWVTGNDLPMSSRAVRHPTFVFPLHFEPHEEKLVLAYVLTEGAPLTMPRVLTAEGLMAEDSNHALLRGLCLGALLMTALFSAGVGLATRGRAYPWLTLHLVSLSYFMCCYLGLAAVYWWPEHPMLTQHTTASAVYLSIAALARFAPEFINLAWDTPMARALRVGAAFLIGAAIVTLFNATPWLVQSLLATSTVVVLGVLGASLQRVYVGDTDAQNFLLAMGVSLLILTTAFVLVTTGAATRPQLQSVPLLAMAVSSTGIAVAIVRRLQRAMHERSEAMNARVESARLTEQMRTRAEAATFESERRSEFLATMSHEIRTPMNGILGTAALLEGTALSPAQRDWVRTLTRAGDHLLRLLNDILDLSRIERTDLRLEQQPFALLDLIDDVQQLQQAALSARALPLYVQLAPGVPRQMQCDPHRLQQIIVNLIANAVKFTREGHIELRVSFDAHAQRLLFEVQDTGCGIAPEAGERIFERFRQVDDSISRRFGGTGLGLAICKLLAEKLGGGIAYRSVVGVGSTFVFDVHASAIACDVPPAPGARPLRRVGVMTDDARLGEMCRGVLEHLGHCAIALDDRAAIVEHCDVVLAATAWRSSQPGDAANSPVPVVGLLPAPGQPLHGTVGLRALRRAVEGDDEADTAELQSAQELQTLAGLRVLVVDDNEVNTRVVAAMLRRMGAEVVTASGGLAAVDIVCAQGARFDAVLMDCEMPDVDGYAATRRIRESGHDVPIVALTAHVLPQYEARARAEGMQAFVAKPVRRPQLRDALLRVTSAARTMAGASE